MKKIFIIIAGILFFSKLFAQTAPAYTSLAIGASTVASGTNSFAAGYSAQSGGITSIALGYSSQANGQNSVSIGNSSAANGLNTLAMGNLARASADYSIAIGNYALATGKYSLAMGSNLATNGRTGSFCFGDNAGGSTTLSNPFGNDADNQMMMRFVGGYKFYLDNNRIPFAINPNGTVNIDINNMNAGTVNTGLIFGNASGEGIASKRTGGGNQFGLDFYSNFISRMSITNAGNIGIGETAPTARLTIKGSETSGHGQEAAIKIQNSASPNSWFIRAGAAGTVTPADGFSIADNTAYHFTIASNGNVGIGLTVAAAKLHVAGNIMATGTITPSDIRYKKNIVPVNNALKKIMSISGYYYSFKTDEYPDMGLDTKKQIGVIAQEVEEVVPEVVTTLKNGYKTVDYPKLIPLLIQGMKEQQQQIEELKKLVAELIKNK